MQEGVDGVSRFVCVLHCSLCWCWFWMREEGGQDDGEGDGEGGW